MQTTLIGIDVGGTKISSILVRGSEVTKKAQLPTESFKSSENILANIFSAIDAVYDPDVEGIGIGLPGTLDLQKGTIISCPNVSKLNGLAIRQILAERYNADVCLNNDANCFALGEYYYGQKQKYSNLVAVILGTGVGTGIIVNGTLVTGRNCSAGEFNRIAFKDKNYEFYCSGQFLTRATNLEGEEIMHRARKGDPELLTLFKVYGENVGKFLKTIIYAVDPEAVVLGASVTKSYEFFRDPMMEELKTLWGIVYPPDILLSRQPNVYTLGAAALCLHEKGIAIKE